MTKLTYAAYCLHAAALARELKPGVVYASDPIGALPGLIAARAAGAHLIYHEHDSPSSQYQLNPLMAWARRAASRSAQIVVFPNAERAEFARRQLDFAINRLRVVWNVPRQGEVPSISCATNDQLVLYYHGNISQQTVPSSIVAAALRFGGRVGLRLVGYEPPDGRGHVAELKAMANTMGLPSIIEYLGELPRYKLWSALSDAHVGVALMPANSIDINMRHMTGASNKVFDYMAAGLPLIVSDLPDWRAMFVDSGHALAADPQNPESIVAAIRVFVENPQIRLEIGRRNRDRIAAEWNYETAFAPVLDILAR